MLLALILQASSSLNYSYPNLFLVQSSCVYIRYLALQLHCIFIYAKALFTSIIIDSISLWLLSITLHQVRRGLTNSVFVGHSMSLVMSLANALN